MKEASFIDFQNTYHVAQTKLFVVDSVQPFVVFVIDRVVVDCFLVLAV